MTELRDVFCPTCGVWTKGSPCSTCGKACTTGPGGVFVYPGPDGMWGGERVNPAAPEPKSLDDHAREQRDYWQSATGLTPEQLAEIADSVSEIDEVIGHF